MHLDASSARARAAFTALGFVVVPDLLTEDELARFGRAVDAAVGARTDGDTRPLEAKSRYEQSFTQCLNLWEDFEDVRALTFHPRVCATAAMLLDAPIVRIWHDQALYKPAHGKSTPAHQDQAYWPIRETHTVTAWIPFDGATRACGGMGYVPGSHRFGVRKFANIFAGRGFDLDAGPEARGVRPIYPDVPAGAVAFHHGLTLHTAAANPTDATRRVHTVIFFADGAHRDESGMPHLSVDRAGIGAGDLIASDVTPVAWPRPDGPPRDSPPPPSPLRPGWPWWSPRLLLRS